MPVRTRTPSHVKWLLNEHAALAGREDQIAQRITALQAELVHIRTHKAALRTSARLFAEIDAEADLAEVGKLTPRKGRYGKEGALQAFIFKVLERAFPASVTSAVMCDLVIEKFELGPLSSPERTRFSSATVRSQLHRFKRQGLVTVEVTKSPGRSPDAAWRWRNPTPTLAELAGLEAGRK